MTQAIPPVLRRQTLSDALRRTALRLPAKTGIVCGTTQWTYPAPCRRQGTGY